MLDLRLYRVLQRVFGYGDAHWLAGAIMVGVKDLDRAVTWYCDKLGLSVIVEKSYSGEVHIGYSQRETPMITLLPLGNRRFGPFDDRRPPILFTRKINSVHPEFAEVGIQGGPIQSDSGGNRFFRFRDLEGNEIEVCVEPGRISK
jgi:catechol 2,3-dioxygenase-like lactoylglutathione lyase family enzyme